MTQEETNQLLLKQIADLQAQIDALRNNATIPFDIGEAMKARIVSDLGLASTSSKGATTENQTVNEAGVAAPYTVLKTPDGFLQITLLSNIYYIPYYL